MGRRIATCPFFHVEKWTLTEPRKADDTHFAVFTVLTGTLTCAGQTFGKGDFFLVPAALADRQLIPGKGEVTLLRTTIPTQS